MCLYVWNVLSAYLNKSTFPEFPQEIPNIEVPLFVTYLKNGV